MMPLKGERDKRWRTDCGAIRQWLQKAKANYSVRIGKEGAREKDDVDAVAAATDDYMILDVGRHMAMCSVGSTSLGNDLNPS